MTSTGVANHTGTFAIRSKLRGPARLAEIRNRLEDIVAPESKPPEFRAQLVVVEGYSFGSRLNAAGAFSTGELGGVVRVLLWEWDIPFVEVAPSVVKKYATGKGNGTKEAVYAAAIRAFPELAFETNDEADAQWLYAMARDWFGSPVVKVAEHRRAVLGSVQWPDLNRRGDQE